MLGVSVDTLRRWEPTAGSTIRSSGGQRLIAIDDVARLLGSAGSEPSADRRSRPEPLPSIVTNVTRDRVSRWSS